MTTHVLTIIGDTVSEQYYLHKSDGIWFLGPDGKQPCIRMEIHKKDSIAVLNMVHYFRYCNARPDMEKGEGTRVMLKAMILAMRKRYPSLKDFVFSDTSYIPCDGEDVDLAVRNLLCYGRTWYMELGAMPVFDRLTDLYTNAQRKLARSMDDTFEMFSKTLPGDYKPDYMARLRRLHKACYKIESWNTFFERLYAFDCTLFKMRSPFLRIWVVRFDIPEPSNIEWHFPTQVIMSWPYQVKLARTNAAAITGGEAIVWPKSPPLSYLPD